MRQCEGKAGKRNKRGEGLSIDMATNKYKHTVVADLKPEDDDDADGGKCVRTIRQLTRYVIMVRTIYKIVMESSCLRPDSFESYTCQVCPMNTQLIRRRT